MAVRHGYTIVPVATVGTEDVVRPVMDVPIREVLTAGGILKPPESSSKAFEDGARFPVVLPRPGDVSWQFFGKTPCSPGVQIEMEIEMLHTTDS